MVQGLPLFLRQVGRQRDVEVDGTDSAALFLACGSCGDAGGGEAELAPRQPHHAQHARGNGGGQQLAGADVFSHAAEYGGYIGGESVGTVEELRVATHLVIQGGCRGGNLHRPSSYAPFFTASRELYKQVEIFLSLRMPRK